MPGRRGTILQRLERNSKLVGEHRLYKGYTDQDGYGSIKYLGKRWNVGRISAHLFLGLDLLDSSREVCHKDEICEFKNCWTPEHLYVGSHGQNMRDRWNKRNLRRSNASISF